MNHVPSDFKKSVVQIGFGSSRGTGFFVANGLILTCAHVAVAGKNSAVVVTYGGQCFDGKVIEQNPLDAGQGAFTPYPDVAVIKLTDPPAHPCVILEDGLPSVGSKLYTIGSTTTLQDEPGMEPGTFTYVGPHELPNGSFLKLSTGEAVAGMSGGPLLDLEEGVVKGLLKTSRASNTDRGGWGISIGAAESVFPGLIEANHLFHSDSAEVHQALRQYAVTLRSAIPEQYPPGLDTIRLASDMSVTQVNDLPSILSDRDYGLYSSHRTNGATASNAFATLQSSSGVTVVLGDPGGGKTTVLSGYCAYTVLHEARLALFIRVSDLALAALRVERHDSGDALDLIAREWARQFNVDLSASMLRALMQRLLRPGEAIIALDGLDEIHSLRLKRVVAQLIYQLTESPVNLLVSSRLTGYTPPVEVRHTFFVEPYDPAGVEAFARYWFGSQTEADGTVPLGRALRAIRDPRLADACRTPVVAGLVCLVAETQEIRESVSGLYHQYVNMHLTRSWKVPESRRTTAAEIGRAAKDAQDVAWAMASAPAPGGGTVWLDHVPLAYLIDVAGLDPRVTELYELDGLLVSFGAAPPNDVLAQEVRWLHRTIHEHLAGWKLRAWLLQRDFDSAFAFLKKSIALPHWRVPRDHAIEQLGDSAALRAIIDRLLDEASAHDTPSHLLLGSALELVAVARCAYRVAELAKLASLMGRWYELRDLVDVGLIDAHDAIELVEHNDVDIGDFSWGLQDLIAKHMHRGPEKIALARRLRERTSDRFDTWKTFEIRCLAEVDPAKAFDESMVLLRTRGFVILDLWEAAPDELALKFAGAFRDELRAGKRTVVALIQAIAMTGNRDVISVIRAELLTDHPPCFLLVALLDSYVDGRLPGQELDDLTDDQIISSLSQSWSPEISFVLGYLVGFASRLQDPHVDGWVAVGYEAGLAESEGGITPRIPPRDAVAAFQAFSTVPLPNDPAMALDLRRSFEWLREGRGDKNQILSFFQFLISPGLNHLNSNTWIMPWLDSAYIHNVRQGLDGNQVIELTREQYRTNGSAFQAHQICEMMSDGIALIGDEIVENPDESEIQKYLHHFESLTQMLAGLTDVVTLHTSNLEFYKVLPFDLMLDLVNVSVIRSATFVSEANREVFLRILESNLLLSEDPSRALAMLCSELFSTERLVADRASVSGVVPTE